MTYSKRFQTSQTRRIFWVFPSHRKNRKESLFTQSYISRSEIITQFTENRGTDREVNTLKKSITNSGNSHYNILSLS